MSEVRSITSGRLKQRDRLVLENLSLVEAIARRVKLSLPPCFDLCDLVQAGHFGLMKAAAGFEPHRSSFRAYARKHIRGAILDSIGLHGAAGKPRHQRRAWIEATMQPIGEHNDDERPVRGAVTQDGHVRETPDPRAEAAIGDHTRQRELRDMVDGAIRALPRREALLIEMYYRGGSNLEEISRHKLFRVNASRASQIHTAALRQLHEHFRIRGITKAA